MTFEEIILSRRSIRRYKDGKIDANSIKKIIRAAMYAPSAVNKRPWNFIIVEDKQQMEKVMEIHPNSKMLRYASQAILICGDENLQHGDGYWIADCGAATQNLLLAAHAMGIGSCWIGIYPRVQRMKDISTIFRLPEHVKPFALVSLGYPDETKEIPDRYEEEKVFFEFWGKKEV